MSIPFAPGDVISHADMCSAIKASLQRGMNFRLHGRESVILMSLRPGAPYADSIESNGKVLIYEGHDIARTEGIGNPKKYDQPERHRNGLLTQNGLFAKAASDFKNGNSLAENVRVFEKIRVGIWAYNGLFELVDSWIEQVDSRKVFKFRLHLISDPETSQAAAIRELPEEDRLIPSWVKLEVWKRDKGQCVYPSCGAKTGLHFDHIIPYSRGGTSKDPANIQILCGRHNLAKRDNIQ
jgi:hypothetical protein